MDYIIYMKEVLQTERFAFISLKENISTLTLQGKLILTIFAGLFSLKGNAHCSDRQKA